MSRSLIPLFSRWDPWADHFLESYGTALTDEDFFAPSVYRRRPLFNRQLSGSIVPAPRTSGEMATVPRDKFQLMVDVSSFTPEEITVKTVDNQIIVTAKHEERPDEHGYVSRQFSRRYLLPDNIDILSVASSLSAEGILTITANQRQPEIKEKERVVPINFTNQPQQVEPKPIPVESAGQEQPKQEQQPQQPQEPQQSQQPQSPQ